MHHWSGELSLLAEIQRTQYITTGTQATATNERSDIYPSPTLRCPIPPCSYRVSWVPRRMRIAHTRLLTEPEMLLEGVLSSESLSTSSGELFRVYRILSSRGTRESTTVPDLPEIGLPMCVYVPLHVHRALGLLHEPTFLALERIRAGDRRGIRRSGGAKKSLFKLRRRSCLPRKAVGAARLDGASDGSRESVWG